MMDLVESLTEDQFLELLLVIYDMGVEERYKIDSTENRLRRIRIRAEEWLEM